MSRTDPSSRRAGVATLAVLTTVLLSACGAPRPADSAAGPVASPVPPELFAGIEVDADAVVGYDDGEVTTPCFAYRAPDPSWTLVDGSAGCSTGVAFGPDMLSMVQVRAVTARGSIDELAEQVIVDDPDGQVTRLRLGGQDVARAVSGWEGTDLSLASYVIAYPDSGLTGGGDPLSAIVLTTMASPEYEAWIEQVIETITRPDGSPL